MPRSYPELLKRLKSALGSNHDTIRPIGRLHANAKTYPILKIILGEGNPNRVLLGAGIHGDEPAGVDALCVFLKEKRYKRFVKKCEITLLPCINPTGYEAGTRKNHANIDLNRKFKVKKPALEVSLVQEVFQNQFDMSLELHEDCESPGFYLYQAIDSKGETKLGRKILKKVKDIMPVNMSSEIDGMSAVRGIIQVKPDPKKMRWWPMAIYSMVQGTNHFLTLETPSTFPLKSRVNAHLCALETALDEYISKM